MGNEQVLMEAEKDVVAAAREWFREAPWQGRDLSPSETRLRSAVYMLNRARSITGTDFRAVKTEG